MSIALLLAGCSLFSSEEQRQCGPGAALACYEQGKHHLRGLPPQLDLARAAASFELSCSEGHAESCLELGLLVQDGRGVPQDYGRAMALYQYVCDAGYGVGCLNLGFMHQLGNGVPADEARAQQFLQQALDRFQEECSGEEPRYCANLGYVLENGFGITLAAPAEAHRAYVRGCEGGDGDACVSQLQYELQRGQIEVQPALSRLEQLCTEGTALACGLLGQLHWTRRFGIARDPERTLAWLSLGCHLGDPQSCVLLGVVLGAGEEIEPRPAEALSANQRACWLGKIDGCLMVAKPALEAWERDHDPARAQVAAEYLGSACRIGDSGACTAFGTLILQGALGPPDLDTALTAFTEACRRRDFGACLELVRAGRPLPLVGTAASDFLEEACRQGLQEACRQAGALPVPGAAPLPDATAGDPAGSGTAP